METPNTITGYIDLQWCAIFDGKRVTLGVSSGFEYPPEVVKEVLNGVEVGDVMDRITGVRDLGTKKGAVSHLSQRYARQNRKHRTMRFNSHDPSNE